MIPKFVYIRTIREAKIAVKIAAKYGYEYEISKFYHKYTSNVFNGINTFSDVRHMHNEIIETIIEYRNTKNIMSNLFED